MAGYMYGLAQPSVLTGCLHCNALYVLPVYCPNALLQSTIHPKRLILRDPTWTRGLRFLGRRDVGPK